MRENIYLVKKKRAKENLSSHVLLRKRINKGKNKWGPWCTVYTRLPNKSINGHFVHGFSRGGKLRIYLNLLQCNCQKAVTNELMQCSYFRQYSIQGSLEPRTHFLLNENATDDFDGEEQPGYGYGSIRMKAHPLSTLPLVHNLSKMVEKICKKDHKDKVMENSCYWNIGVNPVLYRDGRDRMVILTVVVSSPIKVTRRIIFKPSHFKSQGNLEGDEEFELMLDAGDAYSMDGKHSFLSTKLNIMYILFN
jgi:hypothetical protein